METILMAESALSPGVTGEDKAETLNPTPVTTKSLIIDCLELALPPELAFQLNELFGPVGIDSGSLTVEDCVIHIDLNLAKVIHEKWKESVMVGRLLFIKSSFCVHFVTFALHYNLLCYIKDSIEFLVRE